MDKSFGQSVKKHVTQLLKSGRDPNQIAGILSQKDPQGANYGIGIVLDGDGQPMGSSSTLIHYSEAEIRASGKGTYINSAKKMEAATQAVLRWQRIPEKYWDRFKLVLPSDAGTGAVQTAVQVAQALNPRIKTLGVEQLGWPAYKAIAGTTGLKFKEFKNNYANPVRMVLPIYQAGPMNTTGFVNSIEVMKNRARVSARHKIHVVLDRAYSGFEYASQLESSSYNKVMQESYAKNIAPFIQANASFSLALSPTKAFVTFSLRPCGLLLTYIPKKSNIKNVSTLLNTVIRARGSSFEHPITRAFVNALSHDLDKLEQEHEMALRRLSQAEQTWRFLVRGTPMESLFSDRYAGLFRNPKAKKNADVEIYNQHIYPVFSQGRCRLNVTGIPSDAALAQQHVDVFAKFCSE